MLRTARSRVKTEEEEKQGEFLNGGSKGRKGKKARATEGKKELERQESKNSYGGQGCIGDG